MLFRSNVQELLVTLETPVFKNFFINNVVCIGAKKAIFVRGLPEMNVQNVVMENMVITAKHGLDFTEGNNIELKNVRVIVTDTNPVANFHNSKNILLSKFSYNTNAELLLKVTGDKSGNIKVVNSDNNKAKKKLEFNYGADKNSVEIK